MEKKFVLYMHTRKDDGGIFYIGIGVKRRPKSKYNRNSHWHNTVNKHGYNVTILVKDLSWEEACDLEKKMIAFYGRKDLGLGCLVNWTDGGDGSVGVKISEETRQKQSDVKKGEKNAFYKKTHTEEVRKKMSKSRKGKKATKETKQKMSESHKGRKTTEETRKKLSDAHKGKPKLWAKGDGNPMRKEENKEKFRGGNNARAITVLDSQTGVFYETIREAAKLYGVHDETMRKWLNGKTKNKTTLVLA